MQRILISVSNDLSTDQRVKKISEFLCAHNYEVVLIGRKLSNSIPLQRDYKTIRMKLRFNKGFLFYAEFNIRLFFKLITLKSDILLANDLDTLLPNFLVSKLTNRKLVYDSHELFTEVPELFNRPKVRKVWLSLENYIFPKLKNVFTVNQRIADYYKNKYKIPVKVVRNIALELENKIPDQDLSEKIKGDKKMIILQGTGINQDRGAEEAVLMMQYLENVILYLIGSGDIIPELRILIDKFHLDKKVVIMYKMPYESLLEYTKIADLGLSLDKGTNLNYEYSLPNKIFDYIQCLTPILASNREIVAEIVTQNNIGKVLKTTNPKELAKVVNEIIFDEQLNELWRKNLKKTADIYTWKKETEVLKLIFKNLA